MSHRCNSKDSVEFHPLDPKQDLSTIKCLEFKNRIFKEWECWEGGVVLLHENKKIGKISNNNWYLFFWLFT